MDVGRPRGGGVGEVPDDLVRQLVGAYEDALQRQRLSADSFSLSAYAGRIIPMLIRCVAERRRLTDLELGFVRTLDRAVDRLNGQQMIRLHQIATSLVHDHVLSEARAAGDPTTVPHVRDVGAVFLAINSQVRADAFFEWLPVDPPAPEIELDGSAFGRLLVGEAGIELLAELGFVRAPGYLVAVISRPPHNVRGLDQKIASALESGIATGRYRPILQSFGGHIAVVVPTTERSNKKIASRLDRVLRDVEIPRSVRVCGAVAGPAPTVDLIARSYRSALRTLVFMEAMQDPPGVMTFREALPYLLLEGSPELSVDVAAVLDVIAVHVGGNRELIETAVAFINSGSNVVAAAKALGCHRHTVYARIKRFEDLTALNLKDPNDCFFIDLAVRARALLERDLSA